MPHAPATRHAEPAEGRARPAVDERLVMPNTRYEIIDGQVVYVSPADPPHASRHSKLSALLEAYTRDGYDAASDMLTRTSPREDMAPDGAVYPLGPDPETGGRRLEELAFEIASTQSLAAAGTKAARLAARGVRRIFAIDVQRQQALEWSEARGTWRRLADDAMIDDPVFVAPLPAFDLVSAVRSDDAVARALLAKHNPVLEQAVLESRDSGREEGRRVGRQEGRKEGRRKGREEGRLRGKADAVLTVLRSRNLPPTADEEQRVLRMRDEAVLDRWLERAATCESAEALLGGD